MCPPLLVAAVVVAAVGVAAAVTAKAVGDANARGDYEEALRLRQEAAAKYGDIILPKIDAILVKTIGPTELSKIQESDVGKEAQIAALGKYKSVIDNGGMDPQSRLSYMNAQNEAGRVESGMTGRLNQEMAQRGLQGSGMQYAGQLQSEQAGLNRAAQMQAQASSDASQRSQQALGSYAQLGGQVQGEDYSQARDRAMAQDQINKWNANNQQEMAKYNNTVTQENFDNQLNLTGQQANAMNGLATAYTGEGQRKQGDANTYGQYLKSGADSVAGTLAKGS